MGVCCVFSDALWTGKPKECTCGDEPHGDGPQVVEDRVTEKPRLPEAPQRQPQPMVGWIPLPRAEVEGKWSESTRASVEYFMRALRPRILAASATTLAWDHIVTIIARTTGFALGSIDWRESKSESKVDGREDAGPGGSALVLEKRERSICHSTIRTIVTGVLDEDRPLLRWSDQNDVDCRIFKTIHDVAIELTGDASLVWRTEEHWEEPLYPTWWDAA